MSVAKSIGNQVRMRRRILQISQEALGISLTPPMKQQVVSKIERGRKEPSASQLFQIAHQLDVPVAYFFEGLSAPEPKVAGNVRRQADMHTVSQQVAYPMKREA
jgi:transcriptional regulator with XRE-family HTH domain